MLAARLVKRTHVDIADASTLDFKKIVSAAAERHDSEEILAYLKGTDGREEALNEILHSRKAGDERSTSVKKDDGEKAPDRSNKELQPKGKTIAKREVISIDDLDEQFKKMALPLKEVSNRLDQLESRLQQPQQPFQRYTQRPYQNKPNWQKNDFPSPGSGNKNIPLQANLAQIDAAQQLYDPNGNGQQQQGTSQRGDCHFCGQWGHYRQYCPRLGQMLSTSRIHIRDSRICWGQDGSNGPPLPLDRSILQGDSVQQLIDQAMARTSATQ